MDKIDLKKENKTLYQSSSKKIAIVEVPHFHFIMIDGKGEPNSAGEFGEAIEALYPLSYGLKFRVKKGELRVDYGVMPLEALWWAEDMSAFSGNRREEWLWTAMIRQPEFITTEMYESELEVVRKKKNPVALAKARFESFIEGKCAQVMHIGPFEKEASTVESVHEFIDEQGGIKTGKHHEIYLSDMRKAAPEKWRTIIRQPFAYN